MKDKLQSTWDNVPSIMKNRYFLVLILFAIVMVFFDSNNIFRLWERKKTLNQLHKQEEQYKQEMDEYKLQQKAFNNDSEALERFAREEYRMKKEDEDVFIILESEEN